MRKGIRSLKGFLKSRTMKEKTAEILTDSIEALSGDIASCNAIVKDIKLMPSAIRDGIFLECFQTFLLNAYDYDPEKKEFVAERLRSFSCVLAKASPNQEAGYEGDQKVLSDYAKRIIKIIDDCGTKQKAFYLACLSRALMNEFTADPKMNTKMYFKLAQCIRNLTEEDLLFLKKRIDVGLITEDADYIDDFVALGLLKAVNGGYEYTERAFYLKKYALDYEGKVDIPKTFSDRVTPNEPKSLSDDELRKLLEMADEQTKPKWGKF